MLIVPQFQIVQDVLDINEFKEATRTIIIYENAHNDWNCPTQFTVINNSTQHGGSNKLRGNDTLYCTNFYFGTILNPIFYNPNVKGGKLLNYDAIAYLKDYSYVHSMVEYVSDDQTTVNIFDGYFRGDYCRYRSSDDDMVLPSDIRYYNIDHQILKERCDNPFATEDKSFSPSARDGTGVLYTLRELIDKHTKVMIVPIWFDNPDVIGGKLATADIYSNKTNYNYIPSEIQSWIVGLTTRLINVVLHNFISYFDIIIDSELGTRVVNLKSSMQIPTQHNVWNKALLLDEIEYEWSVLCDMGFNVRVNIIYDQGFSSIKLMSLTTNHSSMVSNTSRDTHDLVRNNYVGTVMEEGYAAPKKGSRVFEDYHDYDETRGK